MNYPMVAKELGVTLCEDRKCLLRDLNQHTRGFVRDGVIHWKNRHLIRRGLYTFLKLVAEIGIGDVPRIDISECELLWAKSTGAYNLGLQLGARFPREFAEVDRAKVREMLLHTLLSPEKRERITRWARD